MTQFKFKLIDSAIGITIYMVLMQMWKGCFSIVPPMLSGSLFGAGVDSDSRVIRWSALVMVFKLLLLIMPINLIVANQNMEGFSTLVKLSVMLVFFLVLVLKLLRLFCLDEFNAIKNLFLSNL